MRTVAAALALSLASCATVRPPAPDVTSRARAVQVYNGRLRVRMDGPRMRARAAVLLAFDRGRGLRIEVPGPGGLRLLAVTHAAGVTAAFPADRAVYEGPADAAGMEALLGVALTPAEVMDLLTGTPPARLARCDVRWGRALPRDIDAFLPDGTRLRLTVDEADTQGALPDAAFAPPAHEGYRAVDAEEARGLWGRR